MDDLRLERAFIARATIFGGWFGLVVGATVGFQTGVNLAGIVGGGVGFGAGRIIVRGMPIWAFLLCALGAIRFGGGMLPDPGPGQVTQNDTI